MRRVLVLACCGLGLAVPAVGGAAGGPVPPQQGGAGVSDLGGNVNFIALWAGSHRTVLERVRRDGGVVERTRLLAGGLGVPGVAYDGSNTGLSADGSTLVLGDVFSRTPTRLLVLSARTLRPRAHVVLPGYFTVDAISPNGRWLYLIHYRSASDTNHYEVRAYDLRDRHLVTKPVIDPREPDEKMQGLPVTRTTSPDGRWVYTLYQRPDDAPFIHALDTQHRTAACIDLDGLTAADLSEAGLTLDGGTLRVDGPAGPLALVDTRTFAVRKPSAAPARAARAPARPATASSDDGGGGVPWPLALVALVPLAGLAVMARRRRRRSTVS
jgi:hypothetical protein